MNRRWHRLLIVVLAGCLTACGGGSKTAPENLDADAPGELTDEDGRVRLPDVHIETDRVVDPADSFDYHPLELPPDVRWEPQPCQSHSDCEDGFCVEVVAGTGEFYCAPTCIEECPGDWLCKAVHLDGPDLVSICLPGDGCLEAADGAPCNGSDPCKEYFCVDGFCVGTEVELDLIQDGKDNDCDGKTDEDVYLGFRLLGGTFGGGFGKPSGGGWTLTGTVSVSGYSGTATAAGLTLTPGAPTGSPGGN